MMQHAHRHMHVPQGGTVSYLCLTASYAHLPIALKPTSTCLQKRVSMQMHPCIGTHMDPCLAFPSATNPYKSMAGMANNQLSLFTSTLLPCFSDTLHPSCPPTVRTAPPRRVATYILPQPNSLACRARGADPVRAALKLVEDQPPEAPGSPGHCIQGQLDAIGHAWEGARGQQVQQEEQQRGCTGGAHMVSGLAVLHWGMY